MLVSHVLGDCPGCGGKNSFGNVSVHGNSVLRGCKSCKYSIDVWLPEHRKKILYLDQFFFSSAFKERDSRFVEAAERISHISSLQLLAVPFSSIHEDETHLWTGYGGKNKDDLMEFIKATSRGHEFKAAYSVEQAQITQAFQAFLANKPPLFELEQSDIINRNIHEWDDYFRIDVSGYIKDIELARDLKQQSVQGLVDIFSDWRLSTNTFDEDVTLEVHAAVKGYIDSYIEYFLRLGSGDYSALYNSPIMSMVVESLMYCLPNELMWEAKLKRIGEFFKSQHFSKIPYQWLSVRIYATLKEMVKRGAYANKDTAIKNFSGFFQDVTHVSMYAPYCDAFVMDKKMASIVADPHVALESKFGVKVFSLNNWNDFLAWLDFLEAGMTSEHRLGLASAYPYIKI